MKSNQTLTRHVAQRNNKTDKSRSITSTLISRFKTYNSYTTPTIIQLKNFTQTKLRLELTHPPLKKCGLLKNAKLHAKSELLKMITHSYL